MLRHYRDFQGRAYFASLPDMPARLRRIAEREELEGFETAGRTLRLAADEINFLRTLTVPVLDTLPEPAPGLLAALWKRVKARI